MTVGQINSRKIDMAIDSPFHTSYLKSNDRWMDNPFPCHSKWMMLRCLMLPMLLLLVVLASSCAAQPSMVSHAFGFNAREESPNIEILAYQYGDGKGVSRSSEVSIRQFGRSNQWTNINGPMPVGNSLYVKWRDRSSGAIHEQRVDLRPLLPNEMTNQRIHFVIDESQLFIFLKDMNRYAKPDDQIVGPFKLQLYVTRQIYPN